ncbi:MAG TPA: YIP1 family protein [Solirubrobacteraceae bacterium]|nr:YIP1 family protein [Solirubrobacteraceae bacterium]
MSARAEAAAADERVWLQRAVLVLVRPREVLALMRDDSEAAARARSEAVLALVWLSGIASVLWTPTYGRLQDDVANDALNVAVIAFIGGGLYGAVVYFLGGLVLYALMRAAGGITYRQVRHVLAFAAAPLALSLFVVWPVRLAVFGDDVFKRGGADHGAGNAAFVAIELVFVAWALALLVLGVRALMRR